MKKSRREERREETVQEIKNLAWQQLAEVGADQLSLRKISRDMRMSSAAIFRYFESRQALLTSLIQDAFESINMSIAKDVEASQDLPIFEQVASACRAYRAWALAHPAHYAIIYGSPIQDYSPDWTNLTASAQGTLEIFIKLLIDALNNGEIELNEKNLPFDPTLQSQMQTIISMRAYNVPPEILYMVIKGWTVLHGLVSLEVFNHITPMLPDPSAFFEQTIHDLLQQIGFRNHIHTINN